MARLVAHTPPAQRLSWALYDGESLDQIAIIVEAHPEAVGEIDGWDSALHLACYKDRPLEIVQYLHEKYHEALSSDNPASLPCLEMFRHDSDNAVNVAKFLVNNNPSYYAELSCDASGRHDAFRTVCSLYPRTRLMDFMVKKYPGAAALADRGGWLPLHIRLLALLNSSTRRNIDSSTPEHDLGALIDAYPCALLAKTPGGSTPAQLCPLLCPEQGIGEYRRYLEERAAHLIELIESIRGELSIIAQHYLIPEEIQERIWRFIFPDFVSY